jgi:hypothetical protein
MNTWIKEPLARKKALQKEYTIPQNPASLEAVPIEVINSRSNLNNVTDLFKDNADFINYGISMMTNKF